MSEYLVIAGLSGAGRSQAADDFEDLGWFVIDNLPPSLIPKVVELADAPGSSIARVALVAGTGHYDHDLVDAIRALRAVVPHLQVLFLDCDTKELVRRYEQTRRRHPIEAEGITESIARERELLEPVRAMADVIVDTTDLNVHQLRDRIRATFAHAGDRSMQVIVRSFGFKHGLPVDADLVFDVRFLANPHWVDELRPLTGLDDGVRSHVFEDGRAEQLLGHLVPMLEDLLPSYRAEGKAHLTIAIGCTGGRHRSVAMSEELAARLRATGTEISVVHRDVDR